MIRISERLRTVADMCRRGNVVADIGTDHAYLPIYLVEEGIALSAIAMDLRKGPLWRAEKNIAEAGLSDRIKARLSDGLEALENREAGTITICGMGARLMSRILLDGRDKLTEDTQIILSPQSEIEEFRHFLLDNGFLICAERMVHDCGKYYTVMECELHQDSTFAYESEEQYMFGKCLLKNRDTVLFEYLNCCMSENAQISSLIGDLASSSASEKRLDELKKERQHLCRAMAYYN